MSAAPKIEPTGKREEREFSFCCRHVSCGAEFVAVSKAMAGARAQALKVGWDFRKLQSLQGAVEMWLCPVHAAEVAQKIKNHRAKSLVKYTTEAPKITDQEALISATEKRNNEAMSKFERGFSRILTAAEVSACSRLRMAMQIVEIAGNASASYDGISVDSFNFGSKTIQGHVLDARRFELRCEIAVVGAVQMHHHDAWRVLTETLAQDWNVLEAGKGICKMRRIPEKNEKDARNLAVSVIQKAAAAIIDVRYERSAG